MNKLLSDRIVEILTPYIGKAMAQSSLKVNCEIHLRISPDQLTQEHLPDLCKKLIRGLKVFVGAENAQNIINIISKLK